MEPVFAIVVGALFTASTYLMLQRNVLKIVFGLVLLSNAANLLIFTMGRLTPVRPPLVPEGATVPIPPFANALPQALILTAIVISFGLLAFSLVLVYRAYQEIGTVDSDRMQEEEPHPDLRTSDPAESAAEIVGA
ncbi:MAG TPA: Na+/H+ antiporter subunit C [Gemmatimonadaceae bacterium]|nr:Na+/H+ antiporter subunit C [Gemmatimonadaceae bacterium]